MTKKKALSNIVKMKELVKTKKLVKNHENLFEDKNGIGFYYTRPLKEADRGCLIGLWYMVDKPRNFGDYYHHVATQKSINAFTSYVTPHIINVIETETEVTKKGAKAVMAVLNRAEKALRKEM